MFATSQLDRTRCRVCSSLRGALQLNSVRRFLILFSGLAEARHLTPVAGLPLNQASQFPFPQATHQQYEATLYCSSTLVHSGTTFSPFKEQR